MGVFLFILLGFVSDYSLSVYLISMVAFVQLITEEFCCPARSFVFCSMKMGLFAASCPAGLGECTLRPGGVAHSGFKAYQMLYLSHITMQKLGSVSTMQLWSVGGDDFLNVVLSWSVSSQAVI